ncbi:MAG: sigma-54-dependent Fis family transcriptional regulator [Candidatus Omnitrophica bacterium]|nr:sigma-54-dependent Fis family transcriptional regulator [Candidatus Omnitrophota bacterium]
MKKTVLIVDDDRKIAELIHFHLNKQYYITHSVYNGADAIEYVKQEHPILVMLDIRLPDINGVDVLKTIMKDHPDTQVIMISAHADINVAVECMKLGAYDFIEKPLAFPELDAKVRHVFSQFLLEEEVTTLKEGLGEKYKYKSMLGKSEKMKKVFHTIGLATKSDVNVLIEGESGTGKELVARAIHFNSSRKTQPFIAVNCGAIPENLLESELFGHEKGAFTGAVSRKIGKFEQAQGGTIFLDEIADLPQTLQVKLLRILQEYEIERVGGSEAISIDVRFIVATNRDLSKLVAENKFREDLYYRVNVFPIQIPPLRERKEDIPELLRYFAKKYHPKHEPLAQVEKSAIKKLLEYSWPGNVREFENCLEHLMLIKEQNGKITEADIDSLELWKNGLITKGAIEDWRDKTRVLEETERKLLEKALQDSGGNITEASKHLQMSRDTLYRKMRKYGIQRKVLT